MASLPIDQIEEYSSGSGKPPVSAHPAFPAIVALWFAALLGIGTLIVPVQLIEQLVTVTGISSLITAAEPPLGFTARAAIALVATILGAVIGLVAARRVSARGTASFASSRKDSGMRALNPVEDLEEEFLGDDLPPFRETPAPLGRRRPLAIAEDETRSDFLSAAPLPGENDGSDVLYDDALELSDQFQSDADDAMAQGDPQAEEFMPAGTIPPSIDEVIADEEGAEAPLEIETVAGADSAQSNASLQPLPFSPPSLARQAEFTTAPFDAPHSEDQADLPEADEAITDEVSVPDTSNFDHGDPADHEVQTAVTEPAAEISTSGETVGLVQLVQKLGSTLEKHREWSAERAVAAELEAQAEAEQSATLAAEPSVSEPAVGEIAPEFDPAAPDEAAQAMAAYFSKPADSVAADQTPEAAADDADLAEEPAKAAPIAGSSYQPFAGMGRMTLVDDEDDQHADNVAASFTLPVMAKIQDDAADLTPTPRPSFDVPPANAPVPATEADVDPVDADPIGEVEASSPAVAPEQEQDLERDASYRSLSQMDNPFKRPAEEFVRVEEPEPESGSAQPAVLFPNQQAQNHADRPTEAPAASGPRSFDRPSGQPAPAAATATAAGEPNNPVANEDNEQALRAALMNLQRMTK